MYYGDTLNRVNDGYNSYGDKESYTDEVMKRNTEDALNGVVTLKLGGEFKPVPELALRLGYNYLSPMMDSKGMRDMTLDSYGVMYSSTADYTNWKATNRVTFGVGYKTGGFGIDLAYQFSQTNGDFYPFQPDLSFNYDNVTETNISTATGVSNKRHQLLLTLGYTF